MKNYKYSLYLYKEQYVCVCLTFLFLLNLMFSSLAMNKLQFVARNIGDSDDIHEERMRLNRAGSIGQV